MNDGSPHPYYVARRPQIIADFLESLELARPHFVRLLGDDALDELRPAVMEEFDHVLVRIPYVGGDEGRMTTFFEQNTGVIALGRVLRSAKVPITTIFELMRRVYLARLASLPDAERLALGREWLSQQNQAYLREEALASESRPHAGDFVYTYLGPGETEDGEAFDFGLDYHECGFCKLFKAAGDEDLLPAICAMDREVYALRGIELFRTTTLASGASKCNFRFRAMRPDKKEPPKP